MGRVECNYGMRYGVVNEKLMQITKENENNKEAILKLERYKFNNKVQWSIIIFLFVLIVSYFFYVSFKEKSLVGEYIAGIATQVFSILISIALTVIIIYPTSWGRYIKNLFNRK